MNRSQRPVCRVVVAAGVSSVVTQLLLVREFLSQFQGNEFTISLIFFSWLILGGMGTWLARLATLHRRATPSRLALSALSLAGLSVIEILAVRTLRDIVFLHGTDVGFYPVFFFVLLASAPFGLLNGFLLPYGLFVLRSDDPDFPGARLYMLDNLGDVAGGALFSFFLVFWLTPLRALFLANLPLVASALLLPRADLRRPLALAAVAATMGVLVCGPLLERLSLSPYEGKLIDYRESRYGRITVQQEQELVTVFIDGVPVVNNQNVAQDEETVHFPLAQLQDPGRILIIGACGGLLKEVAKYRPARVDYLEIDSALAAVQLQHHLLQPIAGLEIIPRDGRAYLAASGAQYDAIILNLPEPDTFQGNRFFTADFFRLARARLTSGGVFAFSVAGFDNYLADPQREKLSSLARTASAHFGQVLLLPGQQVHFLCSDRPLDADIPALLRAKGIATTYIRSFFSGNITPERIAYLRDNLDTSAPLNRDTSPFLLRVMFEQWFARFNTSPLPFALVATLLLLAYLGRSRREELVLFSTGFVIMGSETLVILVYQILFGAVYEQIGLLVTVFLAGLLPGAWIGERLRRGPRLRGKIAACDLLLLACLGLLWLAIRLALTSLPPALFLLFGFAASLLCGCQFPLALALGGSDNPAAARVFSADLIGAACGTMVTSLLLIPFLGLFSATAALMAIKALGTAALLWPARRRQRTAPG